MPQYDGSIRIVTKITTKDAEESLASLEWQIKKSAKYMDELRSKMDALKDQKIPTQEYKDLQEKLKIAEKELSALVAEQERYNELGVTSGEAWDALNEKVVSASDNVDLIKEKMQSLTDAGKDFVLGKDTEQYAAMARQLRYEEEAIAKAGEHYKRLLSTVPEKFEKMRASAKKAFDAVSSGAKKSDVSLSKGFKTILRYGFGIRSIYALFNKIRTGIANGFKNLMGYSDSFANSVQSVKNSMSTLGNQIAAAFSPIVQMVIPWLNSLINALTTAMAHVSQFFAILGGKSTFTRAVQIQDKYNKALGGTASAAKKAFGALARFDDLDVWQKQEDASGGGAETTLPKDMFEEVPVDKSKKLNALLDKLVSMLKKLKDAAMPALNALKRLWNEGFSLLADFAWDTLRDFYNYFLVPVGKWVLGEGLPRFFDITNKLLKSINWNVLLKSLKGFYDVLAKITKFTFTALLDFYEHFLAPIATWTMNKALPALLKVLTDLGNKIKWDTLNSALKSMFSTLSKFAVGIGNGLLLFLNAVEPVLTTALAGIINITAEALRFLADVIGMIPEDVLAAIGGALAGLFTVFITYKVVSGIMDAIKTAWVALYVAFDDGLKLLAANPYMTIAAGIGAIVGALMALDEKAAERNQIAEYGQTIEDLCASIDKRSEAVKRQSESVQSYVNDAGAAEMLLAENLAGKYYELAEKENLTNAQKEEMKSLSERLVELMPELANNIDKETGLISAQKDEVYGLIEAKREQYRLEAAKESIVEAYRNQLEAEQNLKEATDLTKQAQEAYNEEVRKYNEAMEDYNKHAYDFAEAPTFQYVVEAKDNWKDLAAELETAATAFDSTQDSIKFLENVMESGGKDCTDGFIEGYDTEKMVQTVRDSAQSCIDAFKETNDSHSPSKVYEGLAGDTIDGYVLGVEKNKPAAISAIQRLAMELKEAFLSVLGSADLTSGISENIYGITELFNLLSSSIVEILTLLNESVLLLMEEMGTTILNQWNQTLQETEFAWKNINDLITKSLQAINTNIIVSMTLANTNWAAKWAQMLAKVKEICAQIVSAVSDMNSQVQSMCAAMIAAINAVKAAAASLGSVGGGGGFSGAGGGGARAAAFSMAPMMADIPQLASGAVIRGGNPFMAILGDQPRGQTNIETPVNLIKDMVAQGIAESGIGSRENIPVNINIIYDGETTARVMIPDILSELGRQGYNVKVLGVT